MAIKRISPFLRPAQVSLEPTFSPADVGKHLGLGATQVQELINFGLKYKASLHPTRGGLYPTFKGAKHRRIPLSAIERHKRHMARLDGQQDMPATKLVEIKYVTVNEEEPAHA